MRNATRMSAIATLAAVTGGASLGAQTGRLELQAGSRIWIEGTSTVHGWECKTTTFKTNFELGAKGTSVLGAGALTKVDVEIPVRTLDCGHGKMNNNMYDALGADANPAITYTLHRYELVPGTATRDSATIRAIGSLEISGARKDITMDVIAHRDGQAIRGAGKVVMLMSDYGVKAPVLMHGLLKTGNQITVSFDLRTTLTPVLALAWDNASAPSGR